MAKAVIITGASNGLGRALAIRYAQEGSILGLLGRNLQRLVDTAAECRAAGAGNVEYAAIDVRARHDLQAWITRFDDRWPVDLLIANAGITAGTALDGSMERPEDSYDVFSVNVLGVVNAVHAVLPRMQLRGTGQIAMMSSLAGFIPLPDLPSYAASKAAVTAYGLAQYEVLLAQGIGVTVICPGYVDTAMTGQLRGSKPPLMQPSEAARIIHLAIGQRKRLVAFPQKMAWLTRLAACTPRFLRRWKSPALRVLPRYPDG
jgi:short-subunit dehydrogenase